MILKLSPIGVFCLLCPVIASNGPAYRFSCEWCFWRHILLHCTCGIRVLSLRRSTKYMGGLSHWKFFKGMLPTIMFAFSSASSVGTLPIQHGSALKARCQTRSCFFRTASGSDNQHGRYSHLPGIVCALSSLLPATASITLPQMLTIVLLTATHHGIYRNCRIAGCGAWSCWLSCCLIFLLMALLWWRVNPNIFDMGRTINQHHR